MIGNEAGLSGQGDHRMSKHNQPSESIDDPTVYEPRFTMEHVYLDTDVRAIETIYRENDEYDDSPGDIIADQMVRVNDWVGACREVA